MLKHRLRWQWRYFAEGGRTATDGGVNEQGFETEAEAKAEAERLHAAETEHVKLAALTLSVLAGGQ